MNVGRPRHFTSLRLSFPAYEMGRMVSVSSSLLTGPAPCSVAVTPGDLAVNMFKPNLLWLPGLPAGCRTPHFQSPDTALLSPWTPRHCWGPDPHLPAVRLKSLPFCCSCHHPFQVLITFHLGYVSWFHTPKPTSSRSPF